MPLDAQVVWVPMKHFGIWKVFVPWGLCWSTLWPPGTRLPCYVTKRENLAPWLSSYKGKYSLPILHLSKGPSWSFHQSCGPNQCSGRKGRVTLSFWLWIPHPSICPSTWCIHLLALAGNNTTLGAYLLSWCQNNWQSDWLFTVDRTWKTGVRVCVWPAEITTQVNGADAVWRQTVIEVQRESRKCSQSFNSGGKGRLHFKKFFFFFSWQERARK